MFSSKFPSYPYVHKPPDQYEEKELDTLKKHQSTDRMRQGVVRSTLTRAAHVPIPASWQRPALRRTARALCDTKVPSTRMEDDDEIPGLTTRRKLRQLCRAAESCKLRRARGDCICGSSACRVAVLHGASCGSHSLCAHPLQPPAARKQHSRKSVTDRLLPYPAKVAPPPSPSPAPLQDLA